MAQKIEIVRGTTNTFQIGVTDADGNSYVPETGEKLVFGIKRKPTDIDLVVVKVGEVIGEGLFKVKLNPEDTAEIECGKYYYDVGMDNGTDFFNIIKPSPFDIIPNITSKGCA